MMFNGVSDGKSGVRAAARATATIFLLAISSMGVGVRQAHADFADGDLFLCGNDGGTAARLPRAVQLWRQAGWQDDDFLSQMQLGDLFSGSAYDRTHPVAKTCPPVKSLKSGDPVEAYVWYFLATRSTKISAYYGGGWQPLPGGQVATLFERAFNRQRELFRQLSLDQRRAARNRLLYVLSCRGGEGFIQLGQLHDPWVQMPKRNIARVGLPLLNAPAMANISGSWQGIQKYQRPETKDDAAGQSVVHTVVTRDAIEALVFYYIAQTRGHPLGELFFENLIPAVATSISVKDEQLKKDIARRADRWAPPYEYYPTELEADAQGADDGDAELHTDECIRSDAELRSLAGVPALVPSAERQNALWFIGLSAAKFQRYLLQPATGALTPEQIVRLMRMAAVRGSDGAQTRLGVMYAKGIGVQRNYAQAAKWFKAAFDRRNGAAAYYLGVLKGEGLIDGNRDSAAAAHLFTQAAILGFAPAANELKELMRSGRTPPPAPAKGVANP